MIIEWPLKSQFHDIGIDVLTSRTDVRHLDDDNDEPTLGGFIRVMQMLYVNKMTTYNVFMRNIIIFMKKAFFSSRLLFKFYFCVSASRGHTLA